MSESPRSLMNLFNLSCKSAEASSMSRANLNLAPWAQTAAICVRMRGLKRLFSAEMSLVAM